MAILRFPSTQLTGQHTMAGSIPVVLASDQSAIPVSISSLAPGAATEATLATRLADATLTARLGTLGQKTSAASAPVVLASDQSAIPVAGTIAVSNFPGTQPVSAASLPLPAGASTETTLASRLADATLTARLGTLGQKAMAGSTPVVFASDQSGLPVSGTVAVSNFPATQPVSAAALPLPAGAATETTLGSRLAEATFTGRINTLGQKTMVGSTPVVIASDQSALPVSGTVTANVGTTNGLALDATLTGGSAKVQASQSGTWTVTQGTAAAAGAPWAVRQSDGASFISVATDRTTAGAPFAVRQTDGTSFYVGPNSGQLPTALVGGRLDNNLGSWLGSTAPTVGQKAMASSVPVALASDQGPLAFRTLSEAITAGAITGNNGHMMGHVATAATAEALISSTAYTEPTSGAQRSVSSSSGNDTSAAGTGARTLRLTFYKLSGSTITGPFYEDVSLLGASTVNTVAADICYIEKIEILTAGSGGVNAGVISLFAAAAGAGGTVASIATGERRTRIAHHYVASGLTCYIRDLYASSSTGATGGPAMVGRWRDPTNAVNAERLLSEDFDVRGGTGSTDFTFDSPLYVTGPAVINWYVNPSVSSQTTRVSVGFFEF